MPADLSIGSWCHLDSPYAAEVLAGSGYDWCCLDMQHGMTGRAALVAMTQAVASAGTGCLVRVAGNRSDLIAQALDAGADGVIVPQVSSAEDAARAVRAARYPPAGTRSWGPLRPKLRVPAPTPAQLDDSAALHLMIEDQNGLDAARQISALPGVTGLFVGPADLALALFGDPRLANAPETIAAAMLVARACRAVGVVAGAYVGPSPDALRAWRDAGFTMLAVDSDSNILMTGARARAQAARAALTPLPQPPRQCPANEEN
jgi:4-hydroxy-2-oxoheptanedioate aldolase